MASSSNVLHKSFDYQIIRMTFAFDSVGKSDISPTIVTYDDSDFVIVLISLAPGFVVKAMHGRPS